MKDDKGLERFLHEKAEEYFLYFEHFSCKNLFKAAVRFHFKHLKGRRFGYNSKIINKKILLVKYRVLSAIIKVIA